MFANVFLKTLRDLRHGLIGWSLGLVVLVGIMAALWPSMRQMPNLDEFLASYPEAMRELFNIEAITTGAGFLNAELYSALLPALFIVFAVGRGAQMVAGEEESGTLEVLLATPVSRARVLLDKAAALALATIVLGTVLFLTTWISSALVDMQIGAGDAAVGALAMVLLGLEHGWLALAVGAATGRRGLAIAVAATVAVAGYLLYVLGEFFDAVEPWQPLSPFMQAIESGPLGGGLPLRFLWMALAAVLFVAASVPVFDRRDVVVH